MYLHRLYLLHFLLFVAVAINRVDDTRPVLDYYKQEGGEENILQTFKTYQARMMAEEEEWNHQMEIQRSRTNLGTISPFSFHRKKVEAHHEMPSVSYFYLIIMILSTECELLFNPQH